MAATTTKIDASPRAPAQSKRRYVIAAGLSLLLLCGAVVYYSPTIVAVTPLRQRIIPTLAPKFNGHSVVGSASLGWFVPVVLYDIEMFDAEGRPLMEAVSVTSEHSLLALALDTQRPGKFRVERPRSHVLLRAGGSNIEDVIAPFLEPDESKSALEVAIDIVDGTIDVKDTATNEAWELADVAASIDVPAPGLPLAVAFEANVVAGDGRRGKFASDTTWQAAGESQSGGWGKAKIALDAQSLPLEIVDSLRSRLQLDLQVSGDLTLKSQVEWDGERNSYSVNLEQLAADKIGVAAPAWLGEDVVRIDRMTLTGGAALANRQLRVDQVVFDSAPASFSLTGALSLDDFRVEKLVDELLASDLASSGRLDLAQVAQILPATLHIQAGTTIKTGRISWDLASRGEGESRRLVGRLDTTNLSGDAAGTPITWDQPIQITVALQQSPAGPVVETIECRSSFLQVAGSGTLAEAKLNVDCNLDRLATELGRFVDLGDSKLAGSLSANVDWQQRGDQRFAVGGAARVENLAVKLPGWEIAGVADASARGEFSPASFSLDTATGTIQQLVVRGGGLNIVEPEVKIEAGKLDFRPESKQFSAEFATLASSAVAFRADELVVDAGSQQSAKLAGKVAFRSDLGRLMSWFGDPAAPPPTHIFGMVTGNAAMDYAGGVTTADVSAAVANFTIAERPTVAGGGWKQLWREPDLRLSGKARYEQQPGKLKIENLAVASNALRVAATGEVGELTGRVQADIDGEISYDLAALAAVLTPHLGTEVHLNGIKTNRFALHGPILPTVTSADAATAPLVSPELTASAAFAWDAAGAYQLEAGPGELQMQLDRGIVNISALDIPVSGGRLQLSSHILLSGATPTLVIEEGPVIQNVRITPEMCRTWLKYVAPAVAAATRAEGTFSTQLAHARVPLTAPMTGDVKGALTVHSAGVGPGPLGQQILLIGKRMQAFLTRRPLEGLVVEPKPWLALPEQEIGFQLVDGRVYHKNMELTLGVVIMRTEGSVGLDQSLDLKAVVPIRDEWTSRAIFSTMKGESLVFPIGGTLTEPKPDLQALQGMSKKMLQGAAQKFLDDDVREKLRNLFGPRE